MAEICVSTPQTFNDPGEVNEPIIEAAHKRYQEIDQGRKIPIAMFYMQYRNGWEFCRINHNEYANELPPEHLVKGIAVSQPIPRFPVDDEDLVRAFKMGYEDCLKAGKGQ